MKSVDDSNAAFRRALETAAEAVDGQLVDPASGADHYHTRNVSPDWSRGHRPCVTTGVHLYYNDVL